jgi:hypothetical protein
VGWFFDAIDLSENLKRGLSAVRTITGLPALILAFALSALCIGLAPLIWYFDVGATLDWTNIAVRHLAPTIPAQLAAYSSVFVLILTLMPTLVELFATRFALVGIRVAAGLVYAFSLFDAVTDWPRVVAFMDAYRGAFDGLGIFAGLAFFVVRLLWLFLASFGFEVLFVVFAVCTLALLLNSRRYLRPATT